ncbi:NAD(P)/FAD-dependent oxidoreductase [Saccharopolyspora halophila]|uniref:NAD(P)/FAD-dependent oxidoreductase n=1 Tax=Saccharopolyspora halophila TaxID=405551 RepID=A0ABN3GUW7_9PSEU
MLDSEIEELRARYRAERDKRLRPDGARQYVAPEGDFGYYVEDPYAEEIQREPLTDEVEALVIGGGLGGLLAGTRLRQAGVDSIRVVEKGGDVGGTWYWNRYPGVRCDIESYIYLPLLEETGFVPSERYSRGEEIRRHAQRIAKHFDLYRDACFQTEVSEMAWDESALRWTVRTDRGDEMRAKYVIISSGPFSRPKLPGIPGIDDYRGHTFHTSRWDYGYTGGDQYGGMDRLADKRVALIGTGATAIQVVPAVAEDAERLLVFQRTPSAVDVRGNAPTDPEWAASLDPGWHQRRRDNFLRVVHGKGGDDEQVDAWGELTRYSRAETGDDPELRAEIADHRKMSALRARVDEVVSDPATAEALKPWYRHVCKRPTFSDEYLQAFNRDDVELISTAGHGVERITENGIVVDGVEHVVDCIVFATGFDVGAGHPAFAGTPIRGRERTLAEHCARGLRSLHGLTSNGFPNLFCLGVGQNAVSVNFSHVLDEQAVHVAGLVGQAEARGARCIEPTERAEQAWVDRMEREALPIDVLAECTPGYYNSEGQLTRKRPGYAGDALEFSELLRQWRETSLHEVLR